MLGRAPKRAPAGNPPDPDEQVDGVAGQPGAGSATDPPGRDEADTLAEAVTTLGSTVGGLRELIGADQLDTRARVSRLEERIVVLEHLVGKLVGSSGEPPLDARVAAGDEAASDDARAPDVARLERVAATGGKRAAAARRKLAATGDQAERPVQKQRRPKPARPRRPDAPPG